MKKIAKTIGEGTFWLSFNSVVLKVVSIASLLLTLSRLDIYEYGLVQLAYSSVGIFSFFVLPGLDDMVLADMGVAKGKGDLGEMKKIFSDYFKIQLVLAIIAWAVLFFGSEILAQYYKGQISFLLKIISFSFLFSPLRSLYSLLFSLNFKFFYQSVYSITEEVLKVSLIAIAFFVFKFRADGIIFAMVFSQFLVLFFFLGPFLKLRASFINSQTQSKRPFWHILYGHGKWSIFHDYTHNLGQHIRLFLIRIFVGTEAVGIFSVAQGLFTNVASLFPLNKTVAPVLSQYSSDKESFMRLVYKSVKYQVLVFIFLAGIAWFAVPPFISILFPKYVGSLILLKIMLISLIPAGYASITTVYFVFKQQRALLFLEIMRITSIVVFLPIFSSIFGLNGVAMEFVFTICLFVWVRNRVLSRIVPGFHFSIRYVLSVDKYDRIILNRVGVYFRRKLRFFGI